MNYTPEVTEKLIIAYQANPSRATVETLAKFYDKSVKSIIGKLSKEGVYRREVYRTKQGTPPITKAELIVEVSDLLDCKVEELEGLEKAPKAALVNMVKLINKLFDD